MRDLHTSHEVSILGLSLFSMGLAIGPMFVGPLSELYGRNLIYRASYILFFAFTWPTAFPPHICASAPCQHFASMSTLLMTLAIFLVFRFLTGLCGAAFLSVAGGSISDLFDNAHVAT